MTRAEMREKVFALIEELDKSQEGWTKDKDLRGKYRFVENQIMYELARYKKIPKYIEVTVNAGQILTFADLERECGNEIYQLSTVQGCNHKILADGTVIKALEDGVLEVTVYVYPERIDEKTADSYEYELSPDVLEVMPYGIAADLLKSDESAEYGTVYANRYEAMKNMLDTRYTKAKIHFRGGSMY